MKRFILWVKGLGWLTIIGAALAAMVFGAKAGKALVKKNAAAEKNQIAKDLLRSGKSKHIQQGRKLQESAQKDKQAAGGAEKAMEEKLDEMAKGNHTLADIADRFNKQRVRKPI